tara:strand:+ start:4450 stop:6291 length:1842 start_codon:yes stop_codon:yes gene_type:complete
MFKPRSDAVQIGYDSFKVVAKNGTNFTEDSIVRFELTRNMGMLDLNNSYLECEIELQHSANTPAQNATMPMVALERDIGANSIISELNIRSEGRSIEQLRGYGEYAKIHYNATKTESVMNKRNRLEGCANSYMPQDNSFYTNNQAINPVAAAAIGNGITIASNNYYKPLRRKVCIPLQGGVFNSPRSWPTLAVPLEVELILQKNLRALRLANFGDGIGSVIANNLAGGEGAGVARQTLYISSPGSFNALNGGTAVGTCPSSAVTLTEGEEQLNQLYNCWYRPGQVVRIFAGAGPLTAQADFVAGSGINRTIDSVKVMDETAGGVAGFIAITFTTEITAGGAGASTGITINQATTIGTPLNMVGAPAGSFGYQMFNPRLVVQKIIPTPAVTKQMANDIARGALNLDIMSWVNIDNAIPPGQTTSTSILPIDLSRVKSIFSVPTNQVNNDAIFTSNALQGQYLNATQYQYQIDGKLTPDRRVNLLVEQFPNVISPPINETLKPYRLGSFVSGFHRYEVEKCLRSANINVTNTQFLTNNPSNLDTTANNFNAREPGSWFVGRSMGAGVGSSKNLVGKSVILYLDYNANSNVGKLLRNFVIHVRTISLGMDGVSVFF